MASQAPFSHRNAERGDLPAIVDIYNATVPSRLVTADTVPVSVASRVRWFEAHDRARRPLWVVELDGRITGWLSFADFHERPAYGVTAELSVYVHEDFRRRGIGAYLLGQAIREAPALGLRNLVGLIFGHNAPSLVLFENFGFQRWGLLPGVSVLDGIPRDVVIVGRQLGKPAISMQGENP